MTRQFTYGRQERLKSRKCIEQLFKEGRSFALPPFRVYWLLHPPAPVVKDGVAVPEAKGTGAAPSRSAQAHSAQVAPAPPSHPAKASFPALQCGVGVSSRQFRKAVDRNRIKRRMRAAVALHAGLLADLPLDVILHPRRSVLTLEWDRLQREVANVFRAIRKQYGTSAGR